MVGRGGVRPGWRRRLGWGRSAWVLTMRAAVGAGQSTTQLIALASEELGSGGRRGPRHPSPTLSTLTARRGLRPLSDERSPVVPPARGVGVQ